jgi:adenine-specific DNA-methyltransferase
MFVAASTKLAQRQEIKLMSKKKKLELTWIGKEEQAVLEPRILIEDPEKSYGDPHSENMLIHGDNLLALKALEQKFAGKVKCVYIDPPFNTGEAFEHYDDGLEHSLWLSLMRDRLVCIRNLLSKDGTLFVHIDDNELAYLTVLLDELFHRPNRKYLVTFKQSSVSGPKSVNPGLVSTASYMLIYAKDSAQWHPSKVFVKTARDSRYSKYITNIDAPFPEWSLVTLNSAFAESNRVSARELKNLYPEKKELEAAIEKFVLSDPRRVVRTARVKPKDIAESCRAALAQSQETSGTVFKGERDGKPDMFFLNGEQLIFYSSKAKFVDGEWITGQAVSTIWDDLLSNNLHNEGGVRFPKGKKPEGLIKRCFELSTDPGDIVLDSFLGSGTTAAVAHKMGLRWIGVELKDQCETHCLPRMKDICDGTDQSGISKAVDWKGGGGFKYYDLAPSLLKQDKHGNFVISEEYNADMLAAAMAKQQGFTYRPDQELYWKQGYSTEQDFIFTTTSHVTATMLDTIADEMAEGEHLLICCKKFDKACGNRHSNIQIKKIPSMLMGRCEFGKEDYSLNIVNLTDEENAPEFVPEGPKEEPKKKAPARKPGNKNPNQTELF